MNNNKNKSIKGILAFLGLPLLIILIFVIINGLSPVQTYNYSEILDKFKTYQVTAYEMNLGSGNMEITLQNNEKIYYTAPSVNLMYSDIKEYVEKYNEKNPDSPMTYNLVKPADTSWFMNSFSLVILPILILCFIGWMFLRRITSMGDPGRQIGFGKAKTKNLTDNKKKILFSDVAGADEEKEELKEVVDFLKNPKKYTELGARIPKGTLLFGPPGTGKTLLARAVAGEADVKFLSVSGSEVVEMYVGVGASRVRDLFEQAKKNTPCVIFIDEIDAVGRKRGTGTGGGNDEREQTLNQILVEMDGFEANENVIVIAATNRADVLDDALTRPGRFDRQIYIGYPDIKGREEILKVHAKGKPFAPSVKLKTIAKETAGFTGADIENLLNESAILTVKRGLKAITMDEIEESIIKISAGTEKKSRVISEKEKRETAYHESGHAIATYFCKTQDKVHQISIIPTGKALGYTLHLPEKDKMCKFKKEMLESIVVLLGGIVAEKIMLNDTSTGASNDLERATRTAKLMVTKFGMSNGLGPSVYGSENGGNDVLSYYSEATAAKIDEEIRNIISECYNKTQSILKNNVDKIKKITEFLVLNEKMNSSQFEAIMMESLPE